VAARAGSRSPPQAARPQVRQERGQFAEGELDGVGLERVAGLGQPVTELLDRLELPAGP
jgi:hypothetical protein